ncbi:MAG TPA: hypothetical protein VLE95_06865 [Chlamydiales bacterium]|nr:hypothetical protein [Chlamydiales bacterium]
MKNGFQIIRPWISHVLSAIKKDIKTDHLPASPAFAKAHFGNRPLNRLTTEEIFATYEKILLEGTDPDLAEWIVNHWVFKHGEIYSHFAGHLSQMTQNYEEIESLTEEQSEQILQGSAEQFGHLPVYLFAVLNEVVFPETVFEKLRIAAEQEAAQDQAEEKEFQDLQTLEKVKERHASELSRLQKKYEGKIAGVLKKYTTEVEALKNQVRSLQKKLISNDRI